MKLIQFLDKWLEEILITCLMGYFVVAIVYEVIARAAGISAPWTEETARYAFIWMTLIGCAAAVKFGNHVRVNILEMYLPKNVGSVIYWISYTVFLIFCGILLVVGIQVCQGLMEWPQKTAVLQVNTVWVYASLPVGMFLTCFRLIQSMVKAFIGRGKEKGES